MKNENSLWTRIGRGEHNVAYKSKEIYKGTTYVLKVPLQHDDLADPSRVTRKWNLANPDLPAIALNGPQIFWNIEYETPEEAIIPPNTIYLYTNGNDLNAIVKNIHGDIKEKDLSCLPKAKKIIHLIEEDKSYLALSLELEHQIRRALNQPFRGILAPYIDGTSIISEGKKVEALIKLYATTRQIVLDYDGKGNLISETETGTVRCVDFDETLCCNSPRKKGLFFNTDAYDKFRECYIDPNIDKLKKIKMGTWVNLSLLYLEKHLKDYVFPLETLNKYLTAEIILALKEFERKSIPLTMKTMDILFFLANTYPGHKLYLSAESIHALEVNTGTFTTIEDICTELHEHLVTTTKKQYLTFIEPEQFHLYLEAKEKTISEGMNFSY